MRINMDFNKAQVYLITDEKQRLYFTGFHSTAGYVVLTEEQTAFVVDNRYFYAAEKKLAPKGIRVCCGADYTVLKEYLAAPGVKALGVDYSVTTAKQLEALKALGTETVDVGSEIEARMTLKTDEELENIAKACKIAEKAFLQAIATIEEGMTERRLAAELEYRFKLNGASDKSFDTIIGFGENSAVPHHETGDKRLKEGMPILMDFGCVYNGYCSDITRTFYFGTPTREFTKAYDAVLRSHVLAYENAAAGMTGVEIDKIARDSLTEDGYGQYFTHSLGHGIGVNIHEAPWVSPKGANKVENGAVFSIEPGVYLNGKFGIRIEDTVVMKDGKPHTMMKTPKELCVLKGGKLVKYNGKGK